MSYAKALDKVRRAKKHLEDVERACQKSGKADLDGNVSIEDDAHDAVKDCDWLISTIEGCVENPTGELEGEL